MTQLSGPLRDAERRFHDEEEARPHQSPPYMISLAVAVRDMCTEAPSLDIADISVLA